MALWTGQQLQMHSTQPTSMHNLKSVSHTVRFNQDVMLQTATATGCYCYCCVSHRIPDLTLVADTRIFDRHLQDRWELRCAALRVPVMLLWPHDTDKINVPRFFPALPLYPERLLSCLPPQLPLQLLCQLQV